MQCSNWLIDWQFSRPTKCVRNSDDDAQLQWNIAASTFRWEILHNTFPWKISYLISDLPITSRSKAPVSLPVTRLRRAKGRFFFSNLFMPTCRVGLGLSRVRVISTTISGLYICQESRGRLRENGIKHQKEWKRYDGFIDAIYKYT